MLWRGDWMGGGLVAVWFVLEDERGEGHLVEELVVVPIVQELL